MPTKDPVKLKLKRQRYYSKYSEKMIERAKLWRINNPDRIKEHRKKYILTHPEYFKEKSRTNYLKNKDKNNLKKREGRKSFEKRLIITFDDIKRRLKKTKSYKNRKLLFNLKEFTDFVLAQESYLRIFNTWAANNYQKGLAPSIDRIDNNGDYSLDNIQIITLADNGRKSDKKIIL